MTSARTLKAMGLNPKAKIIFTQYHSYNFRENTEKAKAEEFYQIKANQHNHPPQKVL